MSNRFHPSADGFMDEIELDSSSPGAAGSGEESSLTLADLGAAVMRAADEQAPQSPEESGEGPGSPDGPPELIDSPPNEPPLPPTRSRGEWAAVLAVALLLFVGGAVALGSGLGDGGASHDAPEASETEASPPEKSGGLLPPGEPPQPALDDPTPSPVAPVPTPESIVPVPTPTADPALDPATAPAPTPVSTPTPTPLSEPTPTPSVAPAPSSIHVGDLIATVEELGNGANVKVSVKVYVHDSSHEPITGASVSGEWDQPGSFASCTTDATGSCLVQTGPLHAPGSITFTVTAVTYEGHDFLPGLNHDPDGDSDGTSITVDF